MCSRTSDGSLSIVVRIMTGSSSVMEKPFFKSYELEDVVVSAELSIFAEVERGQLLRDRHVVFYCPREEQP